MNSYKRAYEEALFKAAIYEIAKDESDVLMSEVNQQKYESPSELLDKRILRMIKSRMHKNTTKIHTRSGCKIALRVVVCIMALVTIGFTVTMSVEALRSRFVSFLMTFTPSYTELQLQEQDDNGNVIEGGQPITIKDIYAPAYIPYGFEIVSINVANGESDIVYQNDIGEQISFTSATGASVTQIDTEKADGIETIKIANNSGILVEKDNLITITWSMNDSYFVLFSQLNKTDTIKIAESVRAKE